MTALLTEQERVVAFLRDLATTRVTSAAVLEYAADAIERGDHLAAVDAANSDEIADLIGGEADARVAAVAVRQACALFAIHPRDLLGPYRYTFLMPARFALYASLRDLGWGTGRVARAVKRDHSTIRNGAERATYRAERDQQYATKIRRMTEAAKAVEENR
jgi:hypothetical protein